MERLRPLHRPPVIALIFAVLTVSIGLIGFAQWRDGRSARQWVAHTGEMLNRIEHLSASISAAGSGIRGYAITGAESSLVPFYHAVQGPQTLARQVDALQILMHDNPRQQYHLNQLAPLVAQKVAFMQEVVAQRKASAEAGMTVLRSGRGERLTAQILPILSVMQEEEARLLAAREAHEKVQDRVNLALIIGLTAFLLALMGASALALVREFERRRGVEASLRETLGFQRAVLDSSLYGMIAVDAEGTISLFNSAAEQMLGYEASEMLGKTPAIFHDMDEMKARAAELSAEYGQEVLPSIGVFTTVPERQGAEEREWTYIRKDGTRFPVLLSVTPRRDESGRTTGYLGIAQNISARKEVERMKNEFISTVSHELRTPLTSIRGALGLMAGEAVPGLPPQARQLIDIAHKNSERLVRLINNILDIEKIESGHITFESRPLSVAHILAQAVQENQGYAAKYNVRLRLNNQSPHAMLLGDQDRLLQVLANLTSNAVKYSPEGGEVTLSARVQDNRLRIVVTDRGAGIPEDFRDKIFSKFAQADSSDTRKLGGTGLGLSISRAIVETMGGRIGFESEPGMTEFYLIFPLYDQRAESVPELTRDAPPLPKKILIVEDDSDIATLLAMILAREGYASHHASSAQEAKAALGKERFAAMTLDLGLPDQPGIELIRELRFSGAEPVPIIVVSAMAEQGKKALNGDAVGILDWLQKPIDAERLMRAVNLATRREAKPVILHVEDDADIAGVMAWSLQEVAEVVRAHSLAEAQAALSTRHFDLALLDIRLPDGDGLSLLPRLNDAVPPIPVIILSVSETAREVQEKVAASLVKSVVSEEKIVHTIVSFIERRAS